MYQISISIIITCHNLHDYIADCVHSIESQTMRPTEVIIIHDGCEPPPVFPNTTTIVRGHRMGVGASRNQGASIASSDNLLFVDADDVLEEYFIEAMVKTKAQTKADIIYPNVLLWSNWKKEYPKKNAWHESCDTVTKKNMLEYNQIVVTSLIPKELYRKVGGTPTIPILEDYQLWMECLRQGATFAKSIQSVLKYRQRTESRLRSNDEAKNEWFYKIKETYAI